MKLTTLLNKSLILLLVVLITVATSHAQDGMRTCVGSGDRDELGREGLSAIMQRCKPRRSGSYSCLCRDNYSFDGGKKHGHIGRDICVCYRDQAHITYDQITAKLNDEITCFILTKKIGCNEKKQETRAACNTPDHIDNFTNGLKALFDLGSGRRGQVRHY